MRLRDIRHDNQDLEVFKEYYQRVRKLFRPSTLLEHRYTIRIDVDDTDSQPQVQPQIQQIQPIQQPQPVQPIVPLNQAAKEEFVQKAVRLGDFDNSHWTQQLINGMKQAGIHGINELAGDTAPVTRSDLKKVVELLVDLISDGTGK